MFQPITFHEKRQALFEAMFTNFVAESGGEMLVNQFQQRVDAIKTMHVNEVLGPARQLSEDEVASAVRIADRLMPVLTQKGISYWVEAETEEALTAARMAAMDIVETLPNIDEAFAANGRADIGFYKVRNQQGMWSPALAFVLADGQNDLQYLIVADGTIAMGVVCLNQMPPELNLQRFPGAWRLEVFSYRNDISLVQLDAVIERAAAALPDYVAPIVEAATDSETLAADAETAIDELAQMPAVAEPDDAQNPSDMAGTEGRGNSPVYVHVDEAGFFPVGDALPVAGDEVEAAGEVLPDPPAEILVDSTPTPFLLGSSIQPSEVEIKGELRPLGDLVGAAFKASGLTVELWNGLPEADREAYLSAQLQAMNA